MYAWKKIGWDALLLQLHENLDSPALDRSLLARLDGNAARTPFERRVSPETLPCRAPDDILDARRQENDKGKCSTSHTRVHLAL